MIYTTDDEKQGLIPYLFYLSGIVENSEITMKQANELSLSRAVAKYYGLSEKELNELVFELEWHTSDTQIMLKLLENQQTKVIQGIVQGGEAVKSKNQINLDTIRVIIGNDARFNEILKVLHGETVYFTEDIQARNEMIRKEFRTQGGADRRELADKYGVSLETVNKVLAKV